MEILKWLIDTFQSTVEHHRRLSHVFVVICSALNCVVVNKTFKNSSPKTLMNKFAWKSSDLLLQLQNMAFLEFRKAL